MNASYLREIALQEFPNSTPRSASSQLHRWIVLNPELISKLEELHFVPRQRALTPLQHEAIVLYLGEPGE